MPLVLAMNIGLPLLVGVLSGDVWGTLMLAGVLRLVVNHHVTFFINSLAHGWGHQPYTDQNTSRDNPILAFFTYGEGYHNFHHLFAQRLPQRHPLVAVGSDEVADPLDVDARASPPSCASRRRSRSNRRASTCSSIAPR